MADGEVNPKKSFQLIQLQIFAMAMPRKPCGMVFIRFFSGGIAAAVIAV
jgi:hypothetical protein